MVAAMTEADARAMYEAALLGADRSVAERWPHIAPEARARAALQALEVLGPGAGARALARCALSSRFVVAYACARASVFEPAVCLSRATAALSRGGSGELVSPAGGDEAPRREAGQPRKLVRGYIDGCFDIMHSGHYNAIRQAKVRARVPCGACSALFAGACGACGATRAGVCGGRRVWWTCWWWACTRTRRSRATRGRP